MNFGDNLILLYSLFDSKDGMKESLLFNNELIVIIFKECLKLYNIKNKTCISKLDLSKCSAIGKINKDNIVLYLCRKGDDPSK